MGPKNVGVFRVNGRTVKMNGDFVRGVYEGLGIGVVWWLLENIIDFLFALFGHPRKRKP
jgi:hypothetical protein